MEIGRNGWGIDDWRRLYRRAEASAVMFAGEDRLISGREAQDSRERNEKRCREAKEPGTTVVVLGQPARRTARIYFSMQGVDYDGTGVDGLRRVARVARSGSKE